MLLVVLHLVQQLFSFAPRLRHSLRNPFREYQGRVFQGFYRPQGNLPCLFLEDDCLFASRRDNY